MKIEELRALCEEQIDLVGEAATVTIILPGSMGHSYNPRRKRLWDKGPLGQPYADAPKGLPNSDPPRAGVLTTFKAREILDGLEKEGY